MSYYYNYYIGYRTPDGKIYPLGPFDANGVIHPALCRSRSYASALHHDFSCIPEEDVTNELRKALGYMESSHKDNIQFDGGKWLTISDLPNGSFIKDGYFLIEDVMRYNRTGEADFCDCISKEVYAAKLQNEITFGPPLPETDEFGQDVNSCRDYMYFAYPNTESEEYEACVIRLAAETFEFAVPKGATMVVIETEG